jgi:hypothetical protein
MTGFGHITEAWSLNKFKQSWPISQMVNFWNLYTTEAMVLILTWTVHTNILNNDFIAIKILHLS